MLESSFENVVKKYETLNRTNYCLKIKFDVHLLPLSLDALYNHQECDDNFIISDHKPK
jgi:hypothetical protein